MEEGEGVKKEEMERKKKRRWKKNGREGKREEIERKEK